MITENKNSSTVVGVPNFFIVGAAKAGTTSLWQYLVQHPDILMSENKEPSFFCNSYGIDSYDQYLALFSEAHGYKAIGEASHVYMTSPESAQLIYQMVPNAKLIFILRNPVDRAYSLYCWMVSHGFEWIYPFEKALLEEQLRMENDFFLHNNPEYYFDYLYFNSGLYSEQLKRYFNLFDKEQIHIALLDDLKSDPVATVKDIYSFLGVDSSFNPKFGTHNQSEGLPRMVSAQFFIRVKLMPVFVKVGMQKLLERLLKLNIAIGSKSKPRLNSDTREMLAEKYRDDIIKTSQLIGRDLSAWLE